MMVRCLVGLALLALLPGCSGGGNEDRLVRVGAALDSTRAQPYADRYDGSLLDFGAGNSLWFRLEVDGKAVGEFAPVGQRVVYLDGRFDAQRLLHLRGEGIAIEAEFRGAHHPLDARIFERHGVLCVGTWRLGDRQGPMEAVRWGWPPALYKPKPSSKPWSKPSSIYDHGSGTTVIIIGGGGDSDDDDSGGGGSGGGGTGGGGTGGSGSGGSSGGSGSGSSGSGGSLDSGGGGLGDDIVFRERR